MVMGKSRPQAVKDLALRLVEEDNLTYAKIAEVVGVHKDTISRWAREAGQPDHRGAKPSPIRERALYLATVENMPYHEIEAIVGIHRGTIGKWARDAGHRRQRERKLLHRGCPRCSIPGHERCGARWCACCDDTPIPELFPELDFSWPKQNSYWWETDLELSPLVQAMRMLS